MEAGGASTGGASSGSASYEALLSPTKTSPAPSASSTFTMAKEDPYLASPSPSVKSPMDLADEELEKMLQKHLGRRPEPLSRVLKRASDPAPLPASLEDSRIGKKVTEFPEEIQKRLLSLYLVGLQPGIHPPEEESELVHLTSDGIWHPVIERLLQGIMEAYRREKRKDSFTRGFESIVAWADRSGLRLLSTQRPTSAAVEVPPELRRLPQGLPPPAEPRALRTPPPTKKPATVLLLSRIEAPPLEAPPRHHKPKGPEAL